jgi:hypothetical protein
MSREIDEPLDDAQAALDELGNALAAARAAMDSGRFVASYLAVRDVEELTDRAAEAILEAGESVQQRKAATR